jgi:hypothetical protein
LHFFSAGYAQLPSFMYQSQADNFGGISVNPADLALCVGDFTLEVSGTASQEINVANGWFTYTPAATGTVRFVSKNNMIYVFEGSSYKESIVPDNSVIVFPDILNEADDATNQTGIYNPANILQNPGFETIPNNTWFCYDHDLANIAIVDLATSGTSIRNNSTKPTKEGNNALLFHKTARFLTQSIPAGKIKPNHPYKVNFRYEVNAVNKDQHGAVIRANLGLTERASDVAITGTKTVLNVATTYNLDDVFITGNNVNISNPVWFSVERTSGYNVNPQKLEWYDRFFLLEGALATGITGATNISYLEGEAYVPEIVLGEGEYYDMTDFIVNPTFDTNINGWSRTTGAQNNKLATNKNEGAFLNTMPFWENWNGSAFTVKMYQLVNGLPAGRYTLKMGVFGNQGGEGLFVYAGTNETAVSDAAVPKFFTVDFDFVVGGNIEIGLNIKSGTNNWVGIDNVSLQCYGEIVDPTLDVSTDKLFPSENVTSKTFLVTGLNLTNDITIAASSNSGLSVNPGSISKDATGLDTGIEVTVTYDPGTVAGAVTDGTITVTSGALSETITVKSFKNPDPTNLLGLAAGNGHTGAGSEPSTFGWAYTGEAVWSEASGDIYLNRYRDGLYDSRVLTFNKNTGVLSFPVVLTAGKSYTFSCNASHMNTSANSTFGINTLANATGTMLGQETKNVVVWSGAASLTNFTFDIDNVATSGTYYLTWTTANSTERTFAGDFSLVENISVGVDNAIDNDAVIQTEYFTLQGLRVVRPVENGFYLIRKTYASERTEVIKAFYKVQ